MLPLDPRPAGYGLAADGVAGGATYAKLYALQGRRLHAGPLRLERAGRLQRLRRRVRRRLPAATAQANAPRLMWKLEALRHKLGDRSLLVTSGFRSVACNQRVGGAATSQHLYGMAADVAGGGGVSLCAVALAARSAGFSGILGPGAPGHGDHVHLDSHAENHSDGLLDGWYWSAPSCGIPTSSTPQATAAALDG